ncbi:MULTISPECIES: NACHT domain-containing NTPase [unclassified Acinetobacter]|uniref:NACHT domain-containing protein n=1 Tax=unclassified Acinetobacter TaxID=196816 RepID=UPI0015D3EB3C|nr:MULTISPECIES: NACHT domain-containing protein [unclassified Acinetobacter]QOW48894.1 NACHT domain-containing protein [Acinetobacter sp. YH12138]
MIDETLSTLVSELIRQFTLPVYSGIKNLKTDASNKIRVTLGSCFTDYLLRNYERYSKTKTLLYREMPVKLKDFYVRTDLRINSQIIDENKFIDEIEKNKRIVVLGSAGCGKSTFCKSIFVELVERSKGIFPIFIELRHLNSLSDKSLYSYILNSMISINSSFNKEQLDYALKLGKILLILDGFDEVNIEYRDKLEQEILYLSNNYHEIRILISSRNNERFSSWDEFFQYKIEPLDKNKALSLINKLDYDRVVKNAFIDILDKKLYQSHHSFSSNPLLLTMMLLTYDQIAEIPNKLHLFYEQAFLTLFNKHDSLKSMYKRKSFTGLALDDFKKCLEAFSILTYCDRAYYIEEAKINFYISNAIKISNIDASCDEFLKDLLESVCILQRDGLGYSFTHRSFQEYFTAQFLVNRSIDKKYELFDKLYKVNGGDNILLMVYDINSDLIEKEWVIPKIKKINLNFNELNQQGDYLGILERVYSGISIYDEEDGYGVGYAMGSVSNKYCHFFHFLNNLYANDFFNFYLLKKELISELKDSYFEEQLLEYIRLNGDIDLEETYKIDSFARELIRRSKLAELLMAHISFLNQQAITLEKKCLRKETNIFSLLLN